MDDLTLNIFVAHRGLRWPAIEKYTLSGYQFKYLCRANLVDARQSSRLVTAPKGIMCEEDKI